MIENGHQSRAVDRPFLARSLALAIAFLWLATPAHAWTVTWPLAWLSSTATAQQSSEDQGAQQVQPGGTAEEWMNRRRAKMQELQPMEMDSVESGLNWLEESHALQKFRAGWHGFHPVLGGFPSGSGQAFGVQWRKLGIGTKYPGDRTPNRVDVVATAAMTIRGYALLKAEAAFRNLFGSPFNVSLVGGYTRNSQEDFYGFGNDSVEEQRTNYSLEVGGGGGYLWWQLPQWLHIGGGVGWRDVNVAEGTDSRFPDTCTTFGFENVPGCLLQPAYIAYESFFEIDWRNPGNPYRGGYYAFRWSFWDDQDFNRFDFNRFEVDLQQYIPFLMDKRVIALRGRAVLTEEREPDQVVPFYVMPILGGNNMLRGFEYARFTDRNSILFQAEYRAEVWMALDVALFLDVGKVAFDRDDLLEDMNVNYGFGFRFKTTLSTFLRADFAFGGDAFRFMFTFDDVFFDLPITRRLTKESGAGR